MADIPQASASYSIVPRSDGRYDVEVAFPDAQPTVVSSFATQAVAVYWIDVHRLKTAGARSLARRLEATD